MSMKKELFSMLALLMTAVPGAWADETLLTTITPTGTSTYSATTDDVVDVQLVGMATFAMGCWIGSDGGSITITPKDGYNISKCVFKMTMASISTTVSNSPFVINYSDGSFTGMGCNAIDAIDVYGTTAPVDIAWNAASKTGTFTMPAYDVELEVTYYTDSELTSMAVDAIDALPEPYQVTVSHKAAIETARGYYDALSDKMALPPASLAKLVADEVALAIAELPDPADVTTADKAAIEAARTAYNALSDTWKTAVGTDYKAKLEADEVALAIAELPSNVTIGDKDAIIAARTAYDALSDDQKTAVGATALAKLVDAEKALCFKVNVPAGGYVTFITDQPLCAYNETSPVAVLYTVSNVEGTTVTLSNAIDIASVNTPLLIYNTSSAAATLYLMPCNAPAASTTSFAGYKGTAVYKAQGADGNGPWKFAANTKYYGFDGQNFVRIVAAGSVAANRCWIELVGNSGARQLTIVRGDATGVSEELRVKSEESATAVWYDLQGRKVQGKPARKGMYLQNGQKIIIK